MAQNYCITCGQPTRKNRKECIGCHCTKAVARKKEKASNFEFDKAQEHIMKNPNLLIISWPSFFKKKNY